MPAFKKILVPVDFGDANADAIDLALKIAKESDAEVTLLHAFDPMLFATGAVYPMVLDMAPALSAAERQVAELERTTRERWGKVVGLLRQGNVYDAILDVAKDEKCDLIIIGTHGRRGLAHAFLGSVAEKVVRLSTVPVLTVHPGPSAKSAKSAA